jgi:hypothetical protein
MIATPKPEVGSRERSRIVAVYCLLAALPLLGLLLCVTGRGWAAIDWEQALSSPSAKDELAAAGVRTIDSVDGWNRTVMQGQRILFVDGPWNFDSAVIRRLITDNSSHFGDRIETPVVRVEIDAEYPNTALFGRLSQFWRENSIHPGGMKNFGGGGRVVWLVDGKVVDYAWGHEILGLNDFQQRTAIAFQTADRDYP